MNQPITKPEARYGMPAADQIIYNRNYIIGYSYYFRQAKWALEIVNQDNTGVQRSDAFRPDYRVPEMFRPDLVDYTKSGYDRGHLVASANQVEGQLNNSETFLLSNMSPQRPKFNRRVWKQLETAVRGLDSSPKVLETYVLCGPVFYFDQSVETIGKGAVTIPVPHAYFKSILTESNTGALKMWSFVIPNEETDLELSDFSVSTTWCEQITGIKIWQGLIGSKINRERSRTRKMWTVSRIVV